MSSVPNSESDRLKVANAGHNGEIDERGLWFGDEVVSMLGEICRNSVSCLFFNMTLFSYNDLHAEEVRLSSEVKQTTE